jgi:flagellin
MSRINTNVTSLIAQHVLNANNQQLSTSLERLSTGLRINTGADDPAGLIASENLREETTGISTAIDNGTRAGNIVGTAEGGLNEVSSLLNQLSGLVGQSASSGGLSQEEQDANQLQVDSILSTVNRIAGATSFEGKQLLNGNLDYTTGTQTGVANVNISSARIPDGGSVNVNVAVTASANDGRVKLDTSAVGAGLNSLSAALTIEVAGNEGTQQLSFANGTAYTSIVTAVNAITGATGVKAALSTGGKAINFDSQFAGSDQFVSVKVISESAAANISGNLSANGTKVDGSDAVVSVNGAAASAHGTTVTFRNNDVDLQFDLTAGASGSNNVGGTGAFTITGGGATFNLGSRATLASKASIGIQSVSTSNLGDTTNGFLNTLASGGANDLSSGNFTTAQAIIDKSIKQVSELRGRLGAFQKYTVGSTVNSLNVALENATSAESAIRDTDFAAETANLTRAQILSQAATTVLSQANAAPQQVLKLLG